MDLQILEYLTDLLTKRREALVEAMADGSCKDYAAYQHCVGQVRGLLTAQSEIDALVQRVKDQDE